MLLVQPDISQAVGFRMVALPEPLHLEMVAALVPQHDVRILDMRLDSVPNIIWRNRDGVFVRNHHSKNRVDLSRLPMPRRDPTASYRNEYFFLFDKPDTSVARHPELVAKWVDIGPCAVLLGLEGGCDETLKNVNKSCDIDTNNQAIKILHDNGVIIWGCPVRSSIRTLPIYIASGTSDLITISCGPAR